MAPLAFAGEKVTTFFLSDALGRSVRVFLEKPLTANHANLREEKLAWGSFYESIALFLQDPNCSHSSANFAFLAVKKLVSLFLILISVATADYRLNRSPMACFMTAPPTSEIDRVSGISFGQASTQFCANPHS